MDNNSEAKQTTSDEDRVKAKKDLSNMTLAEQAKLLKKHNPEALAKLDREIAIKSEAFRKKMRIFTFVLAGFLIYILFFK
jgi:hypothetical protein